ncbi:MAG: competence/damage-inducible protein A [Flavihumibacter sp.]|nr:competence/damage-inducible protein A [Flavihumibacter sp.]
MSTSFLNASIITIGDELLIGQVVDTNSAWIAQELNKMGVWVRRRVAVGDNREDIIRALDEESQEASIIIMTGGLGPTADDITKPLLCGYFGGKMVMNEKVLEHIKHLFEKVFKRPAAMMLERNIKQAEVPDVCTVLHNARGTAPGMWFEKNGKVYVSLPGVPHEMKGLMTDSVLPKLQQAFAMPAIVSKTMVTYGVGESMLAERIKDFEENLPPIVKLAYLPNHGLVRLRLTAKGNDKQVLEAVVTELHTQLKQQLSDVLVTDTDASLENVVANLLLKKGKTMGTAESCTGGFIAQLITAQRGSSAYYKGGVVSYANTVKQEVLGVAPATIQEYGAVSEATVKEMVAGALKTLGCDYVVATSGIMGPDGGTEEKPVGTVWVGVGNKNKIEATLFQFRFDRRRNIDTTAMNALNLLRKFIVENE